MIHGYKHIKLKLTPGQTYQHAVTELRLVIVKLINEKSQVDDAHPP